MSAPPQAHDLAPVGPIGFLDRSFAQLRQGGAHVAGPALAGGAWLAATVLGVYYVERVEGVHSLRPFLALALVAAWVGRASLLGRSARRVVEALTRTPTPERAGRALDVTRTAAVVGLGLWFWLWLLALGSLGGAAGIVAVLPLFALRGLTAPSWLARASCVEEGGVRAFVRAVRDTSGRRGASVLIEGLLLLGAVGLVANLYAATLGVVLVARSFLGLDVTAISTFMAPTNVFLQLVLGASALTLLEPLRASLSAVSFVDARVRAEGLDLRAGIDRAVAHAAPRRAAATASAAALLLTLLLGASVTRAQDGIVAAPPSVQDASAQGATTQDAAVSAAVDGILARGEFREFDDARGRGLRRMIERLAEWAMRPLAELPQVETPSFGELGLPGPIVFLTLGGALVLGVFLYLLLSRRRDQADAKRAELTASLSTDLRDRAPRSFLDDAAALAQQGRLRDALRSLYLATLVSLDRRRLIAFDPHRTNWHYLRQMPASEVREAFQQFTRLFDYKWYGREDTTVEDYERCRALASSIVQGERP